MRKPRTATLLLALACAPWPASATVTEAPVGRPVVEDATAEGGSTRWARPDEEAPSLSSGDVKARVVEPSATEAKSGYAGLRALATAEGEARLQLADGEQRTLRPGDQLGADVVQAVDEGLLVLFRPQQGGRAGGESTVVIRFDTQGHPSVRVYYTSDPVPAAPPEPK